MPRTLRRSSFAAQESSRSFKHASCATRTRQSSSGLPSSCAVADTRDMITKNIGMLLLAIYLIAIGILTLTGLGIGIITGVLALLAGIFILIGR
jgi:hypothetical protein